MEPSVKNVDPDIVGRVMALEQRARGLNGRVSALEMRFSSGDTGAPDARSLPDARSPADVMEFIPGEPPADQSRTRLEDRVAALEAAMGKKAPVQKVSMLDITGILVGITMLAVGLLLATDSVDLLKNPLLAFAAGFAILACAAGRLLLK